MTFFPAPRCISPLKKSKTQIQNELRKKLGILVDVTKQGCGSTNDGNTARIFFRNFEVVSEITGFDRLNKKIFCHSTNISVRRCYRYGQI